MEIPFYYSFKEFETNYQTDLENFIIEFPSAREIDFLNDVKRKYLFYSKMNATKRVFNNKIWIKTRTIDKRGNILYDDDEIELSTFCYALNNQYKSCFLFYDNDVEENEMVEYPYDNLKLPIQKHLEYLIYEGLDEEKLLNREFDFWYIFDLHYHKEYLKFIGAQNSKLFTKDREFKDFEFSVLRILDFVEDKQRCNLISAQNGVYETKPEIIEIQKLQKTKFTTPEKIALLEYFGIFAKLHKEGVSAENEYRIIENLIGGSNVKKYCLNRRNNNKSFPNEYKVTDEHRKKVRDFYNSKTL